MGTAHDLGYPVLVHAIGDRAIEMVLDALERDKAKRPGEKFRDGIVHVQITDEALLGPFPAAGCDGSRCSLSLLTTTCTSSGTGPGDMADTSYAWKTLADKGVHVSFGTDCPVESCEPMPNIYTAVTRKNLTGAWRDGLPAGGEDDRGAGGPGLHGGGRLRLRRGSRKGAGSGRGMLADFIMPDRDIFALADEEELRDVKILATYVGGEKVFERE